MVGDLPINFNTDNRELIQRAIVFIGAIVGVVSLFSPNPLLCVPAFVTLYFIVRSIFLSRYLAGFLLAFVYQWIQVSIKPIYANLTFQDISVLTSYPDYIVTCYLLCSAGLVIITLAINVFLSKINYDDECISEMTDSVSIKWLLIAYFFVGIFTSLLPLSLYQIAVQISAFKWGIFYIIFICSYDRHKGIWIIVTLVLFEFVLGFASYFSTWKDVIFYTVISSMTVIKMTPRKIILFVVSMLAFVYIGLLWTGVKGDYRTYIGQGAKQVMAVSKAEALMKMIDLASEFNLNDDVMKSFIDRISYIDYFSACMSHVPSVVHHENGRLTVQAVKHVLVPRFLDNNKAVIDESTHLTKYTGIFFSNLSMGVSFSLGYFGDFYVDFGEIGMLVALFLLGLLIGAVFWDVYRHISNGLISAAVMQMSFFLLYKFEISLIKLIGFLIMFWIVYRLMSAYVFPKFSEWITIDE